jgi:hypothetical protein
MKLGTGQRFTPGEKNPVLTLASEPDKYPEKKPAYLYVAGTVAGRESK